MSTPLSSPQLTFIFEVKRGTKGKFKKARPYPNHLELSENELRLAILLGQGATIDQLDRFFRVNAYGKINQSAEISRRINALEQKLCGIGMAQFCEHSRDESRLYQLGLALEESMDRVPTSLFEPKKLEQSYSLREIRTAGRIMMAKSSRNHTDPLSGEQKKILRLAAKGLSSAQIGKTLGHTQSQITTKIKGLCSILGLRGSATLSALTRAVIAGRAVSGFHTALINVKSRDAIVVLPSENVVTNAA